MASPPARQPSSGAAASAHASPPPPVFTHPLLTGSPIEERAYREAIANQCVKQSTLVAVVVEDRPEAGR